jgi:DNA-binding GntR family transcriptional regulator
MHQSGLLTKSLSLEIDKKGVMPNYAQIAEAISKLLDEGEFRADALLPPERVFCKHYGVSRTTLRQELDALECEELAFRQLGLRETKPGWRQYKSDK